MKWLYSKFDTAKEFKTSVENGSNPALKPYCPYEGNTDLRRALEVYGEITVTDKTGDAWMMRVSFNKTLNKVIMEVV